MRGQWKIEELNNQEEEIESSEIISALEILVLYFSNIFEDEMKRQSENHIVFHYFNFNFSH